jgi:hypothetical protein
MRLLVTDAAAQPPRHATAWLIMTLGRITPMEKATQAELIVRALAEFLRSLLFDIAPWFIAGLIVAVPFGWLLLRIRKSGMGNTGLTILTGFFTSMIAATLAAAHFFLAFGEAFGSAVDRDRPKAFIAITVAFPLVMAYVMFKNSRNEKKGA